MAIAEPTAGAGIAAERIFTGETNPVARLIWDLLASSFVGEKLVGNGGGLA